MRSILSRTNRWCCLAWFTMFVRWGITFAFMKCSSAGDSFKVCRKRTCATTKCTWPLTPSLSDQCHGILIFVVGLRIWPFSRRTGHEFEFSQTRGEEIQAQHVMARPHRGKSLARLSFSCIPSPLPIFTSLFYFRPCPSRLLILHSYFDFTMFLLSKLLMRTMQIPHKILQ